MPRMDVTDLPPGTTRHVMSPEPPIRGFIIAGVLSIVGAVLMIISIAKSWHEVVTIIFIAVLACGIALAVTAAWSMVHMKLYVDLDDKGYHIHGAGQDRRGTWDKVTKAALTESRSRLTLYHGQVGRTHIVRPGIGDPKEMDDLAVDVAHRLDESRGYRQCCCLTCMAYIAAGHIAAAQPLPAADSLASSATSGTLTGRSLTHTRNTAPATSRHIPDTRSA